MFEYYYGPANGKIQNSVISNNLNYGIYVYYSNPTIKHDSITANGTGIYCDGANPILSDTNSIFGNSEFGIFNNDPTHVVDARYTWWGDPTGPYHPVTNPGGQGNALSDSVRFIPWVTPPPAIPLLAQPSNGLIDQQIPVTFSWQVAANAQSYRLQVATDSLFAARAFDDSTITGTSRQVASLNNSTTYYWRVRAKNIGGTSGWSSVWHFTTIIASPKPPNLMTPANGATNQPTTLTLTWNQVSTATTYRLQVDSNSSFTSPVVDTILADTSKPVGPLRNKTTYYWHVNATNIGGTSAYSTTWHFTTIVAVPQPPVLAAPANGATDQPVTLTLRWNPSQDAATYRLQMARDSGLTLIVRDDSSIVATQEQVGPLDHDSVYFWRVQAKNLAGTSAWSLVSHFTTIVALPEIASLILPVNGAQIGSDTVLFMWNRGYPKPIAYEYQRTTDSTFSTNVDVDSSLVDTFLIVRNLTSNKYWWRVRVKNAAGWGLYSEKRVFTVNITSVQDARELPHEYSLAQNYPNPFNPTTMISFDLPKSSDVRLIVYDVFGKEVQRLVDNHLEPGRYTLEWNVSQSGIASGVYFYHLQAGSFSDTKKLLLIK